MSWLWPEKRRKLIIVGSEGMLTYDESDQTVVLHKKGIAKNLENRDDGEELIFRGSSQPLQLELEHFLSCVQTRRNPLTDGESAVEVVHVLEEANALLEGQCKELMFMNRLA
jgi:predicted dehydrogenase